MSDYEDFSSDYKLLALGIHFGVLQSLLSFEPDVNRERRLHALHVVKATLQGINIDERTLWDAVAMSAEMLGLTASVEENGEIVEFPTREEEK